LPIIGIDRKKIKGALNFSKYEPNLY